MKKTKKKIKFNLMDCIIYVCLSIFGVLMLYPFWHVLIIALNDAIDAMRGGIYIWPRVFTTINIKTVLNMQALPIAFMNSVFRTVMGVSASLIASSMLAFTLSRREYIFRKIIQRIFVVTMYVNGGLIPFYFVIKGLGLRNNFLVYIIPMLLNAYYVIIIRSYMDNLPNSLYESAKIEGANDFTMYYKIALPLSKPVIAAIALFIAVDQWNSWFDTFIYTSKESLTTMQMELVKILTMSTTSVTDINQIRANQARGASNATTPESIRMAITIVATVPILMVYPFIQKYFIKGITVGAVKG